MEISQLQSSTEKINYPEKDDRRIQVLDFLGYKIYVGRNALSNDRLVTEHKVLHKKCIWVHVFQAKGSHVIICRDDVEGPVNETVFRRAMDLALWFSAEREKNKKIIWAELQDVFKPIEGVSGAWKTYKKDHVIEV